MFTTMLAMMWALVLSLGLLPFGTLANSSNATDEQRCEGLSSQFKELFPNITTDVYVAKLYPGEPYLHSCASGTQLVAHL